MSTKEIKESVERAKDKLKRILGPRTEDALKEPLNALLNESYESITLIRDELYSYIDPISSDTDIEASRICDLFNVCKSYIEKIAKKIETYSTFNMLKKADDFFAKVNIPVDDEIASSDLRDLKRLIKGEMGLFFNPEKPVKHFLTADIQEKYFEHCLDEFKKNRSEEFIKRYAKANAA